MEPSPFGTEDTALFVLEDVDAYVLRHHRPQVDPLTRWFLEYGNLHQLLADAHELQGNREEVERLYQAAAGLGNSTALRKLVERAAESGHGEKAERLYLAAIDNGDSWGFPVGDLASSRGEPVDSYERHGIEADGTLSESWPWPVPRAVGATASIEPELERWGQPGPEHGRGCTRAVVSPLAVVAPDRVARYLGRGGAGQPPLGASRDRLDEKAAAGSRGRSRSGTPSSAQRRPHRTAGALAPGSRGSPRKTMWPSCSTFRSDSGTWSA
ncbi:hypothetical protein [Streptomyces sioyaensis]|uniref:hypothetical protein n=1 Tax=Streptomyces sioyaensis TaxID=67364 RepID=UPI00371E3103